MQWRKFSWWIRSLSCALSASLVLAPTAYAQGLVPEAPAAIESGLLLAQEEVGGSDPEPSPEPETAGAPEIEAETSATEASPAEAGDPAAATEPRAGAGQVDAVQAAAVQADTGQADAVQADAGQAEAIPGDSGPAGAAAAPPTAEQALQQEGVPSLVSPEQIGAGGAPEAPASTAPQPKAPGEREPNFLEKVPWWAWAMAAAAVLVLASSLSGGGGGGGGGGSDKKDSDDGTVGYTW